MSDPVIYMSDPGRKDSAEWGYCGPGWYFYDETWAYMHGPFGTEQEARENLKNYCETV